MNMSVVLMVEDNPGDARLLREMFKERGSSETKVVHVERMKEAEDYLATHTVDLILLDLGLPDAQGSEGVRRARAAAPRTALVVLSGLEDEAVALKAMQEGAQDYLVKGRLETTRGERTFHREGEDHYLFVQAVRGTPFALVASVPLASLYGPISGAVLWTPWFVFAALVVGAAYLLRVLSSLSRSQLELRSVSTELARSNSELRDFAVIASHDLQEPLRKIQAFGERLAGQTEGTLDPKSADYLARMRQVAARMQSLARSARVLMHLGPTGRDGTSGPAASARRCPT